MFKKGIMILFALALSLSVFTFEHGTAHALAYDHTDPIATGCANDAKTVKTATFNSPQIDGLVELRYSPTCRTIWGRITLNSPAPSSSPYVYMAGVERDSGPYAYDKCRVAAGNTSCYTPQLNDAGYVGHAEGYLFDERYAMDVPIYQVNTASY